MYEVDRVEIERLAEKIDYFVEQLTVEHKWSTEYAVSMAESVFKGKA